MTYSVIVTTNTDTVIVSGEDKFNVITDSTPVFNVVTEGIQGPPGPSGFGGYITEVIDPETGDLMTFSSNKWINVRRTDVSDGGNF